jgi:hypothetical protein
MIGRLSLAVGLLCIGATVFGFAFVIWTRYGGGGGFFAFRRGAGVRPRVGRCARSELGAWRVGTAYGSGRPESER